MKVLYLIHHAGKAGTERYVLTTAKHLRDKGLCEPFFVYCEDGLLRKRMEELNIPTLRMPLSSRYDLRAAKALATHCRKHQIDVIHTQFLRENYIALLSRLFYAAPAVVYTNHLIMANNFHTRLSNQLLSRLQGGVIAVCNPGRDRMIQNGIPESLIRVIHNGVEPSEWARIDGSALRSELGIHAGDIVMLYAARLVEGKGHDFLLDALSRLDRNLPFTMMLAGEGPLTEPLKSRAAELGLREKMRFLGFREDIRSVLAVADINVNTATTEACSYNILEAMAASLPQIAADAGGNPDLITDGENGYLIPPDNPALLADTMKRLITDSVLRRRIAAAACASVTERFHLDTTVQKTYTVYQEAVKRGNKSKAH